MGIENDNSRQEIDFARVEPGNKRSFMFDRRRVEFSPDTPLHERLRLLADPGSLTHYQQMLFAHLFRDELPIEPFSETSIMAAEQMDLTPEQKKARWILLQQFGFVSEKFNIPIDASMSVPHLGVYFGEDPTGETLTTQLNRYAEGVKRLGSIGQTDPTYQGAESVEIVPGRRVPKVTRLQHTQELALSALRSTFTMAITTPDLFIQKVRTDMERYTQVYGDGVTFHLAPDSVSKNQVGKAVNELPIEDQTESSRMALELAMEYGKYITLAAYLHDYFTPGWGDIVMKARASGDGQRSAKHSEDTMLGSQIVNILNSKYTYLPQIVSKFGIDAGLLSAVVKGIASEGFPTLPNDLMKDKRKYSPDLLARPELAHLERLRGLAAFDLDQRSGTQTNAQDIIESTLPGGFVRMRKGQQENPIGSFEERARLLMYMVAKGIPRHELERACIEMEIDPQRVYIAAQEIDFGPNVRLEEVFVPHQPAGKTETVRVREFMPVVQRPGDAKRQAEMFFLLTSQVYQGPVRSTKEALLQDMITSALHGNSPDGSDPVLIERDFIYSTDIEVTSRLQEVAPIMVWVLQELEKQAEIDIVTEDDLLRMHESLDDDQLVFMSDTLIKETTMSHLVDRKPGTLVKTDEGGIKFYEGVIRKKRRTEEDNPLSLPARLDEIEKALRNTRLFRVIKLKPEAAQTMRELIESSPESAKVMNHALSFWAKTIQLRNSKKIVPSQMGINPMIQGDN